MIEKISSPTPPEDQIKDRSNVGHKILRAVSARHRMSHGVATHDFAYSQQGTAKVLSVFTPGIAGNIHRHIRPFMPYVQEKGDVLLVQPSGERYFQSEMSQVTTDAIWQRILKHGYDHLVVNGISMGGNTAYDALTTLNDSDVFSEQSVRPHSTMFDTPSSRDDLVGVAKIAGPYISRLPFGRISNLLPVVKYGTPKPKISDIENPEDFQDILTSYEGFGEIPTSFFFDQLAAITARQKPSLGSMAFLDSMAYYQSLRGDDIVDAQSSIDTWQQALNDTTKWKAITVDSKHVDFEGQPTRSKLGLADTYNWHLLDK